MKKVRQGYKMTEIGEIPDSWKVEKLKDIGKVIDSLHETPIYSEVGFPMIRVVDVNGKAIDVTNTNKVSEEVYNKFTRKYKPKLGDIIMSRVGSYGLVSYLKSDDKVCLGQNIVIITTDYCKKYLFYALNSKYIKSNIDKVTVGSSQKTLSLSNINDLKLIVPTIEEQERIASILSTVDEQIDNIDGLIEKNKELKKGLMQQLLTKGIGHTKFKKPEIGEIPEEWEVKSLEQISNIVDYRGKTPEKVDKGILLITAKNINKGFIDYDVSREYVKENDYEKIMYRGLPKKGDVLFTTEAPLGNVANVDDENIALAQRVIKFRGNEEYVNNYFLKYYMLCDTFQMELLSQATGSTVLGIKGSKLKKLLIALPNKKEQEKIVSILSEIDKKIEGYETKKKSLEELKKGLMQQLLTGNIRVI